MRKSCWAGRAEAGDESGIEAVGFVAATEAFGVVFDAAWVGDMNTVAGGVEAGSGQFAVTAGRFEDGQGCRSAVLVAPGAQGGEALGGVLELGVMGVRAEEQAGVELGLGDIEAEAGVDGSAEDHEDERCGVEVWVFCWFWTGCDLRRLRSSAGLSAVYRRIKWRSLDTIRLLPERRRERVPI